MVREIQILCHEEPAKSFLHYVRTQLIILRLLEQRLCVRWNRSEARELFLAKVFQHGALCISNLQQAGSADRHGHPQHPELAQLS